MFFCAVMGNLTYAGGVLIKAKGWSDIYGSLPWLVGSLGTVVFDFIIVVQCFVYRNKSDKDLIVGHFNKSLTEEMRESLLESNESPSQPPSRNGSFLAPGSFPGRKGRRGSILDVVLDRDGATPVYLDSGTQHMGPLSGSADQYNFITPTNVTPTNANLTSPNQPDSAIAQHFMPSTSVGSKPVFPERLTNNPLHNGGDNERALRSIPSGRETTPDNSFTSDAV